ncbi:MAG: hypothetical protein LZF84_03705, partial [Nitrosomonas sp.]
MQQSSRNPPSRTKTFLFDIGRVLLDFDFESSLARLIPSGTADAHERIGSVLHRKDALESGQIDPAGFADWTLSILG